MMDSLVLLMQRDMDRVRRAKAAAQKHNAQQPPAAKPDTFNRQQPSEGLQKEALKAKADKSFISARVDHFMRLLEDVNSPF